MSVRTIMIQMRIIMMCYLRIFLAAAILVICIADDDYPEITIENGPILGKRAYTVGQNKTYYAFRGIPFAEPPVGDLRFSAPVKASNWTDVLNATEDKSECVQDFIPVSGDEDCLYINVYTPNITATNLSVMVWIYGGAFIGGNSSYEQYGPDYLLDEDIVFVSFNYRVGIFGYLSTEDEVCSGNWALKDQLLALQWVQSNIAYFGGNPNNVTLFGQSAGAASVSYLLQTNKTEGLFNAAIMHSGTSLNLWALNRRASQTAFAVGRTLGIIATNSSTLVESLREVNYARLQVISYIVSTLITTEDALEGIFYGPVIEPDYDGAIFVNKSHELLSAGGFRKIPTIMGFTSNEASAVGSIPEILRLYLLTYDLNPENYAPADLTNSSSTKLVAGTQIKQHYFGLLGASLVETSVTIKFISDDQFNRPIREAALQQSKYAPVWLYEFSYEGALGGVENRTYEGVGHTEDIWYIFRRYYDEVSQNDTLTRERMIRMWTNFAKYGNPTPEEDSLLDNVTWTLAGSDRSALNYLNIDTDLEVEQNPFEDSMEFYDEIYDLYGEPPYDTY